MPPLYYFSFHSSSSSRPSPFYYSEGKLFSLLIPSVKSSFRRHFDTHYPSISPFFLLLYPIERERKGLRGGSRVCNTVGSILFPHPIFPRKRKKKEGERERNWKAIKSHGSLHTLRRKGVGEKLLLLLALRVCYLLIRLISFEQTQRERPNPFCGEV